MRGLASFTRSTALSNGMDAQRSAGVLLSSPAAAQRCAEGAGLDSGAPAEAQSAMPSIALPCSAPTAHGYPPTPAAPMAPQLQPRISTSLTDVTKYDLTFAGSVSIPLMRDIKNQMPDAICESPPGSVNTNLIINRDAPPFDNPELRRAMALSLDRKAFVDILTEGQGFFGGVLQPPPGGLWGMPGDILQTLPGYGIDVQKNRTEAREIMQQLGYRPDHRLKVKASTRDTPPYRDPAVILIDQLKDAYIDADLETIDTAQWYPKVMRKDYTVALNLTGSTVDDPDQGLYENYTCGAEGNYNGYCNPEVDKLVDQQSMRSDRTIRKKLAWQIERRLAEDGARPIVYYNRAAVCWQPYVKGLTIMINSIYNGWRMEDLWLDK